MSTVLRKEINIKLTGEGISPENIDAIEIAKFITSLVEAMKPLAEDFNEVSPLLNFQNIARGSVALTFSSCRPDAHRAYSKLTNSISTGNYRGLPTKSIDALNTISKQLKRSGCAAVEFHDLENRSVAKITPSTVIKEDEPIYIEGETTIYGYVESVGGNEKYPHARIKFSNESKKINCAVRDKEQIRKLGSLLYTEVGLVGFAKWRLPEMEIEHFSIKEILDYRGASFSETIDFLSKIAGNSFDNLDVENWLTEVRGDAE